MHADFLIESIRREQGEKLYILGHFYQADEVLRHADAAGDSLDLSRRAALAKRADRIVFCGVHFMAESAALLAGAHQSVYMPDIEAGCPMADMAVQKEVRTAWTQLQTFGANWTPIVYVNSSAAIKAFCGEHGGATCTSSNAAAVFRAFLDAGRKILFIPDEHLGVNTACALGLPKDVVGVYDPSLPLGGLAENVLAAARVLCWKGYCHVHAFVVRDILDARRAYPDARIIVHPETPHAAACLADERGSTAQIIRFVEAAPDGATVIVGTEINLVKRLARQHQDRLQVLPLRASACRNMALTTEVKLLRLLGEWPERNCVRVPKDLCAYARSAMERMLQIK